MPNKLTSKESAYKFYNENTDKILAYKKAWYAAKTKKYHLFSNIKIKGFPKQKSNGIIKKAIDNNILHIILFAGDECKKFSLEEFIKLYTFKDFSIIEVNGYADQFIKDDGVMLYENLTDIKDINEFVLKPNAKIRLEVFENQLNKI